MWDEGRSDQRDALSSFLGIDDGDPLKTEFHCLAPSFFLSTTLDIFHDILTLQTRTFKTKL